MNILGVDLGNIFSWLLFGLIVGFIAHSVDPSDVRGGLLGTVVTGIVGALLGGVLASALFGLTITGFNFQSVLIAVGGALILAFIQRAIFREPVRRT